MVMLCNTYILVGVMEWCYVILLPGLLAILHLSEWGRVSVWGHYRECPY